MNERLARCRALLDELKLDGIVVSDLTDVRYLSGFRGEDATLVVGRETAAICTDSRFWEQVHEEVEGFTLVKAQGGDLLADTAAAAAEAIGLAAVLGFQGSVLSYAEHRGLRRHHRGRLRDVRQRVSRLRIRKDAGEADLLRCAGAASAAAVSAVVARGLVGRRERDVAWALREEYEHLGAEGVSFPTIVATGDHGAHGHAIPGERVIASGELVVIDTGAVVEGYCGDITRTIAAGEPSARLREIYAVVLEAQLAGVAAVRAGAHGRDDVDAACRAVIAAAGYAERFGHGTGHGVGLKVHEAPNLGRVRGDRLEAGMVCTVEPGIYIEGLAGVRIEDTVLVTADGCEILTPSAKDLLVVD